MVNVVKQPGHKQLNMNTTENFVIFTSNFYFCSHVSKIQFYTQVNAITSILIFMLPTND